MKEVRVAKSKNGKEDDFIKEVNFLCEQGYDLEEMKFFNDLPKLAILTKHIDT